MQLHSIHQLHALFTASNGINKDTRTIEKGQIYFALSGDQFDGHDYVEDAFQKGASYCVVDRSELDDDRCVHVANTLKCLQDLAQFHRMKFSIPILGLTGSNGKTTTKELIGSILSQRYQVRYTQGNLNNHIGVPLTLLQIEPGDEFGVIEMGANHVGEIKQLCKIANPVYGLITNIGKAHIGEFGGQAQITKGKKELFDFVSSRQGTYFLNAQDVRIKDFASGYPYQVNYSKSRIQGLQIEGCDIQWIGNDFLSLELSLQGQKRKIDTKLYGSYNTLNIVAAIAVALYASCDIDAIERGLSTYIPNNNRSQILHSQSGKTIFLDAYNANPDSMRLALDSYISRNDSNQTLILGDMLELGDQSSKEHQEIVSYLGQHSWSRVLLVGKEFSQTDHPYESYRDTQELLLAHPNGIDVGNMVLIKGSRGLKLEQALSLIQ